MLSIPEIHGTGEPPWAAWAARSAAVIGFIGAVVAGSLEEDGLRDAVQGYNAKLRSSAQDRRPTILPVLPVAGIEVQVSQDKDGNSVETITMDGNPLGRPSGEVATHLSRAAKAPLGSSPRLTSVASSLHQP
jgi:hypothetical protein